IAKALAFDAKVIVMDEPTAALSAVEVSLLFNVIEGLRSHGAAVLFISHRLEEISGLCQRVTVLRDGRWVLSREAGALSSGDLVRAGGNRFRSRGSSPAGARHGDVDRTQRCARLAQAPAASRLHPRRERAALRPRLGGAPAAPLRAHLESGAVALRRQPAEGR